MKSVSLGNHTAVDCLNEYIGTKKSRMFGSVTSGEEASSAAAALLETDAIFKDDADFGLDCDDGDLDDASSVSTRETFKSRPSMRGSIQEPMRSSFWGKAIDRPSVVRKLDGSPQFPIDLTQEQLWSLPGVLLNELVELLKFFRVSSNNLNGEVEINVPMGPGAGPLDRSKAIATTISKLSALEAGAMDSPFEIDIL